MLPTKGSDFRIIVSAEREIAYNSPDHILPWGTRRDNSRNRRFNQKLYQLYPKQGEILRVLDLGCSGGGFVKDCLDDGCLAVGIEGSDFSRKYYRAEWATIPDFLFTGDIVADFEVLFESEGRFERVEFDVVTSWEVMEHIAEHDLPKVAANVRKHLRPTGLWIMSVSPNEEIINGMRLHQTVRPKSWWVERFEQLGFYHLEDHTRYFSTQFVRGPKYDAPGSFHLVLSPDPSMAPRLPKATLGSMLLDRWLGSRSQRLIRRLLVGD